MKILDDNFLTFVWSKSINFFSNKGINSGLKHYKAAFPALKCTGTNTNGKYCIIISQEMITLTYRIIVKSSKNRNYTLVKYLITYLYGYVIKGEIIWSGYVPQI